MKFFTGNGDILTECDFMGITQIISGRIQGIAPGPQAKKAYRAAKGGLPFIGTSAVGIALYHACPEFKNSFDQVRNFLNQCPRGFEMLTSGLTMGLIPDIMAQRFEGQKFNWKRLAVWTALGAINGGIIVRRFYNLQNEFFPDKDIWSTIQKISVDNFAYTPIYTFLILTAVLATTNLFQKKTQSGIFKEVRAKLNDILPKNWLFWTVPLFFIYNYPSDLMIYAQNTVALLWYPYLSKKAHNPQQPEEESGRAVTLRQGFG